MKTRIVVPTDFSNAADNALDYALELAKELKTATKIVHFYHVGLEVLEGHGNPIFDEILEVKQKELVKLAEKKNEQLDSPLSIDTDVVLGFANPMLRSLSREDKNQFIIMGTKGENASLANILGSTSTYISQQSHCPVWLIPGNSTYTGIKKLLFAIDFDSANWEGAKKIQSIVEKFDADIHLVHVNTSNKKTVVNEKKVMDVFGAVLDKDRITIGKVNDVSVWEGLNQYAEENSIDAIIMATRHRNTWQNIFHRSSTKDMIFHATRPLVVVHLDG